MTRREAGFTLIELLIVIALMGFVLAVAGQMAMGMLRTYKQQSKAVESNIEGIVSLEMMRRDIGYAGYGLPWTPDGTVPTDFPAMVYAEATNALASPYNDSAVANTPPRAILSGNNIAAAGALAGTDYLVIKAVNVARNDTCIRWTYLLNSPPNLPQLQVWGVPATETDLDPTDLVSVIAPGTSDPDRRILGAYNVSAATALANAGVGGPMEPISGDKTLIVYGIGPAGTPLRMPFNRADYYVSTTLSPPGRCAPGTGMLVKAVVNHNGGGFGGNTFPVLECVADMQVFFGLDVDDNGTLDGYCDDLTAGPCNFLVAPNPPLVMPLTAAEIRRRVKEVRIYILTHEGRRDPNYSNDYATSVPANSIVVGDPVINGLYGVFGRAYNFPASGIPNWQNYRWKVYTIVTQLNLR